MYRTWRGEYSQIRRLPSHVAQTGMTDALKSSSDTRRQLTEKIGDEGKRIAAQGERNSSKIILYGRTSGAKQTAHEPAASADKSQVGQETGG